MKYSIFDIANWFLNKESVPQKKLQKLCYYAKAWTMVLLPEDNLDFSFQAWVHGPVNAELWKKFKRYGYYEIERDALEGCSSSIDVKTTEVLELVWNTYGEFNGFQLENLTHSEDPWINARKGLSATEPSTLPMNNQVIKDYYADLYSGDGIGE